MDIQALGRQAVALHQQGRLEDAEALYRRILATDPRVFAALYLLGVLHLERGDAAGAVALIERALALNPHDPNALTHHALALGALARFDEALRASERALARNPHFPPALAARGAALLGLDRLEESLASYDAALAITPGDAQSRMDRAKVLRNMGLRNESLADYEAVLTEDAANAEAWNGRGEILRQLGRTGEAQDSFAQALALHPEYAAAFKNRGDLRWSDLQDHAGAVADLEQALALDPALPELRGALLHLKMFGGDWADHEAEVARINQDVRAGKAVAQPFVFQAITRSPADSQICSRIHGRDHYPPRAITQPHTPHERPRIRIGYVSGEFHEQAVSYLMAGLFECHDRAHFEIVAFNTRGPHTGAMRKRLVSAFDAFIDIDRMSDAEAAARIRAEGIDILVTLNGYFGNPRLGIFAHRPAPVQVSYLGFPATLGLPYIDYVLADRIVLPESEAAFYDEKVAWLPDTYWVNDSKRAIAPQTPSRTDCGLPEDAFVFCNFNNTYKLTPDTFASWMRILRQAPGSVLWLWDGANPVFAAHLRRAAAAQDVDPARLIFAGPVEASENLARLKLADLALDSLPYGAHTTAADVLWAGTPILTCLGTTWPGRVAASLLHAIAMPELVTNTLQDYEALAVALAQDPARLRRLREKLAANRLTTPLFDTVRFARNMEAAYAEMIARWRRGEAPAHISVPQSA
ncbi:MAG: hypothetical protein BGN82_03060 [Alphaproteobacteria bacterium 65-7]|nr:MAG: hypothetical protein BGN82_03060 [Alphaproteobacteria bacterium 65-7]